MKVQSRKQKATKILTILEDYCGQSMQKFHGLDIGCADGSITRELAPNFHLLVGSDVNQKAIVKANKNIFPHLAFVISDGSKLTFGDESFDIVICAQVYEHTQDQLALAEEVWRILRPGGVCFFSGPNRFAIIEEHYWLPFLSWLPQNLANAYMRLAKKGPYYDIKPQDWWRTQQLWHRFEVSDYCVKILRSPNNFGMGKSVGFLSSVFQWMPSFLMDLMKYIIPNYNWILVKPK